MNIFKKTKPNLARKIEGYCYLIAAIILICLAIWAAFTWNDDTKYRIGEIFCFTGLSIISFVAFVAIKGFLKSGNVCFAFLIFGFLLGITGSFIIFYD